MARGVSAGVHAVKVGFADGFVGADPRFEEEPGVRETGTWHDYVDAHALSSTRDEHGDEDGRTVVLVQGPRGRPRQDVLVLVLVARAREPNAGLEQPSWTFRTANL